MEVRAFPVLGLPRGLSIRRATVDPKSCGKTSAAGFALSKVSLVHSGFTETLRFLLALSFIPFDLPPVGSTKADHMNHIGTRSEDQCMQSTCDHAQGLESTLSIINPEVFDNKRAVPFKLRNKLERNAAQGNVPLVLLRVEADRHALLYIRIYNIARPRAQGLNAFMPPPFCGIERHAGRRCGATDYERIRKP